MMEAIIPAVSELIDALAQELGANVVTQLGVQSRKYIVGICKSERQSRHFRHRDQRAEHIAGHVHLKLVLLQHTEHGVVGAERTGAEHFNVQSAVGFGALAVVLVRKMAAVPLMKRRRESVGVTIDDLRIVFPLQ